jgi:hypothetical protein
VVPGSLGHHRPARISPPPHPHAKFPQRPRHGCCRANHFWLSAYITERRQRQGLSLVSPPGGRGNQIPARGGRGSSRSTRRLGRPPQRWLLCPVSCRMRVPGAQSGSDGGIVRSAERQRSCWPRGKTRCRCARGQRLGVPHACVRRVGKMLSRLAGPEQGADWLKPKLNIAGGP